MLVSKLLDKTGALPLVQLKPEWEELFAKHQVGDGPMADVALPPADFNRLAASLQERLVAASNDGRYPAVVTSTRRRRFLRDVLSAKGVNNPVLSFEEIGAHTKPSILGAA